jgi:hypothetical protein
MIENSVDSEYQVAEEEDYQIDFRPFDSIDDELDLILEDLNALLIEPSEIPSDIVFEESTEQIARFNYIEDIERFDDVENYSQDLGIGRAKITKLEINLGSDDIFRISCVNHKINLAIRTAIISHPVICNIFKTLNKFCDNIRSAIATNNVCKEFRTRLCLENATRWGSAFSILEMYKKAFDRGVFKNMDCALPFDISTINLLLEILKPAYAMSLNFQSKRANIADVVPVIFLFRKIFKR